MVANTAELPPSGDAATCRRMTVCGVAHINGDVLHGVVLTSAVPIRRRTLAERGVPIGVIALVTNNTNRTQCNIEHTPQNITPQCALYISQKES